MTIRSWLCGVVLCSVLGGLEPLLAQDPQPPQMNQSPVKPMPSDEPSGCSRDEEPFAPGLEGVQVETSDVALFEQFFGAINATPVRQLDHPQRDKLREYCYRGVAIVVRQDLSSTRPTGWVQLNFSVPDATAIQRELERAYEASAVFKLAESERSQIIRFRLKPDVMRGRCRAVRFEVAGPEGFMIGFDQFKPDQCRKSEDPSHEKSGRPHHQ